MAPKEVGRRIMAEVIGESYTEARDARRNEFNSPLFDYSEDVCFGDAWARPGIDRKQRSMLCIAMLVALNRPAQLRIHIGGALNNGCSVEEIREALYQAVIYCGLPAAVDAYRIAEEVLTERGLLHQG